MMTRMSARILGEKMGLTAREVNVLLKDRGFLEGEPGAYRITDEGSEHGETVFRSNGYGGSAARSWEYDIWDEDVMYEISDLQWPDIAWWCDGCGAYLNDQSGFTDRNGHWQCAMCGYDDPIDESRIRR
ncbi:Sec23/Sec24 zinc finger-containing protein [Bifidobacterium saguinibicoloris]|uniref:Sec23/Sec24 zinc finger-containing protein n=1 Tax=Bifidobacterium saguinibicoloris TaxID=2834433 RepID=UPI001C593BBC|nr:Sec23/Sec24 zinc finger-containing protein [Bifidobacterium saguinibicoloris]MBW3080454.1 Sec23/Sec24 zinc finger-containing protein [Bifidobacterium saguinibicoloris]